MSKGDRFPGINVATLRLLRAAVLKRLTAPAAAADTQNRDEAAKVEARIAALREGSRERAAEVLASRPGWTRTLPDDDIWMTATAAEAAFLQSDWALAEQLYRAALRPENQPLPHHFASAGGQLVRLTEAFAALGTPPPPPFDRPAQFLSALQPKPETLP